MSDNSGESRAIEHYSFMVALANDGTIDANELAFIESLALRDGVVDDEERAVLSAVFNRVSARTTTPLVWSEIQRFKAAHKIP